MYWLYVSPGTVTGSNLSLYKDNEEYPSIKDEASIIFALLESGQTYRVEHPDDELDHMFSWHEDLKETYYPREYTLYAKRSECNTLHENVAHSFTTSERISIDSWIDNTYRNFSEAFFSFTPTFGGNYQFNVSSSGYCWIEIYNYNGQYISGNNSTYALNSNEQYIVMISSIEGNTTGSITVKKADETNPAKITGFYPGNDSRLSYVESSMLRINFDREVSSGHVRQNYADLDFSKTPLTVYRASDDKVLYRVTENNKEGISFDVTSYTSSPTAVNISITNLNSILEGGEQYYITMGAGFVKLADGTASPEIKHGDWEFSIKNSTSLTTDILFNNGFGNKTSTIKIEWNDGWFRESSLKYNHALAITSMGLSGAAYNSSDTIINALIGLGFEESTVETFNYTDRSEGSNDLVAFSLGTKFVKEDGQEYPLIAVVVRGTPGNEEWYSNFKLGMGSDHAGFSAAADNVWGYLELYITNLMAKNSINGDDARYLVVGHSRGAAVANLISAKLTKNHFAPQDQIFGYTFATPTVSSQAKEEGFENIFNILNMEDFVTRVPLEGWNYKRYGIDLILPSSSFTTNYNVLYDLVADHFESMTSEQMSEYSPRGVSRTNKLNDTLFQLAPSLKAYYQEEHLCALNSPIPSGNYSTAAEYFSRLANILAGNSDLASVTSFLLRGGYDYLGLTEYFISESKLNNAINVAHCQAYYYSWLAELEPEDLFYAYDKGNKTYTHLTFACPIDVYIYNSQNDLVAAIEDEVVTIDVLPVWVKDNIKHFDIPGDQEYQIRVVAYDKGNVNYEITEMNNYNGTSARTVRFEDLQVNSGDELWGRIDQALYSDAYNYRLTRNDDEAILPTYDSLDKNEYPHFPEHSVIDENEEEVEIGRLPFADVSETDWYYDAISFVYGEAMMEGIDAKHFAPNAVATRAMIVTILWRLEGKPDVDTSLKFNDVFGSAWYAKAVRWAVSRNIVKGYSQGIFKPDEPVTREQLAALLYRYSSYKGEDVSSIDKLTQFIDGGKTSSWAKEAIGWAVARKIVSGKGNSLLDPTSTSTRAEVAQMFMNFICK